jgi:hypothetical protein
MGRGSETDDACKNPNKKSKSLDKDIDLKDFPPEVMSSSG